MSEMDVEDLRLLIYDNFRRIGRVPPVAEMATDVGLSPTEEVTGGIEELARQRHVALDDDGEIAMAHPFASINLGFEVMGRNTLWWGGCCWDSFALPHLLTDEPDVLVATQCPGCGQPQCVGRESPRATGQRLARPLPGAGRACVGRRGAHVRQPTSVLQRGVHRRLAGAHRQHAWLRDGHPDVVELREPLVRRPIGTRVRAA